MINYSLVARSNPADMAASKKIYALAQYSDIVELDQFAEHMAKNNSPFSKGTLMGILTDAVSCLRELLLEGRRVKLGDMGTFAVQLNSSGADSAELFSTSQITAVKAQWTKSDKFADLLTEAQFNYVATREAQANARQQEKNALSGGGSDGDNVVTD